MSDISKTGRNPLRRAMLLTGLVALPLAAVSVSLLTARTPAAEAASPQIVPEQPPRHPPRRPPHPPLPPPRPFPINAVTVKSITVNATVRDGVAETEVSHIFQNRSGVAQEGDFVFPIPDGATVSSFAMYDGETKLDAKLLDKEEATATYEEIVRRRRDPALLTYQGRAALRARVFPIQPNGERRLTLKLVTVLPREGNAKKYAWTLVGPYLPSNQRPESVSVRVTFDGKQTIGSVYSPTHEVRLRRDSESKVVASWEMNKDDSLGENPEFDLYATAGKGGSVALSSLAYNASLPQVASVSGGMRQSGYFLVVASPTISEKEVNNAALSRRVVMVMDRSGSMQGKKIEQAKSALRFALGKLRPQDAFNLVTFSDRVETFAPEPVAASPDNRKRAEAFVDDIVADGGTNINEAMKTGLAMFPEKSSGNTLLFFTDGLPTVGERSQERITKNAVEVNSKKARTFVFGVGYDVDVPFLDQLSLELRGDADYVRPDEDIEVKTSQFVAKTNAPVLENLKLALTGTKTGEIYPKPDALPDLFAGSQLILVGRYTGEGAIKLTLTGEANGKPQSFALNASFPAVDTGADFLPRLWASRKIGYLMDEVRLRPEGDVKKEIIEQIITLSREYGILTPYTAMFVPEPGTETAARGLGATTRSAGPPAAIPDSSVLDAASTNRSAGGFGGGGIGGGGGFSGGGFGGGVPATPAPRQGEAAVNASQGARSQKGQVVVGNASVYKNKAGVERKKDEDRARRIRNVSSRTFYQAGTLWTDVTYDPKKQKEVVKVKLYSAAYFDLTRRNADFARWASLGDSVLIAANSTQAVQFCEDGKEKLTEAELKALAGK